MNKKAFTLVEILVWILILSIVTISWFYAYSSILIWKSRLIEKTDIQKESFYFTEKLFELIKKWWTLDYEEYFNRKVVWTETSSWHFLDSTWYWNFWSWSNLTTPVDYWDDFYQCRSWNWDELTGSWCYLDTLNTYWEDVIWKPQRYWQYSFQFIDYNSNYDNDNGLPWDENLDWKIIWDDDDEYMWNWPTAFTGASNLTELYLISWDKKRRTLFRWNKKNDTNAPGECSVSVDYCLWTVEFLKLEWVDYWLKHDSWSLTGTTLWDWVVDTWLIDTEFTGWSEIVAWSWAYRVELFPESINVSNFEVFAYPNIDVNYAWWSSNLKNNISPYTTIHLELKPSRLTKRILKQDVAPIIINTTINLSEIYSQ